jgi:ABC-2 type transport system permease protein
VGAWLPLTHAIDAARRMANGAQLSEVGGLIARELGVAAIFLALGLVMLGYFEDESRRRATLERT